VAAFLAACAGGTTKVSPVVAPAPHSGMTAAAPVATPPADHPTDTSTTVTPARSDTVALVPLLDSAAEHLLVADSAADEEVLEELRGAAPAEGSTEERGNAAAGGGAESTEVAAVTWDIDVTSFLSHERVQYYLDFFQGPARERFGAWLQRMPRYEPMIRARLARQGLPGDLLYLALIESGFSNSATSRARAVGMWQFMPSTGRQYGLRVDRWVDERRDPVKATDAAARHLNDLRTRFGSLYLAAAAYNAGGGKVSRGLRKLGDAAYEEADDEVISDSTFFLLYDSRYLRRETKDYVPKLIAAALIAKEPAKYGFAPPEALPPFAFDSIVVPDATGLDVVARLAGTDVATLRELNPQFLRLITPPGARATIRLPVGSAESTTAKYAELPVNRRVTFKEHVVRSGETLGHIAKRYGVPVTDIRQANHNIAPNRLRLNMTLIIPVSPAFDPRAVEATEMPSARRSGGRAVGRSAAAWHTVRRGESWWSIGERYGVRVGQLQDWNDAGPRERLRIGQKIRVRSGGRAVGRAAARVAPAPARPATYRVRSGDTLSGISARYSVAESEIRRLNGLSATAPLRSGKVLKLR
jgi:membrane-bound lytic murein transglycosylase D